MVGIGCAPYVPSECAAGLYSVVKSSPSAPLYPSADIEYLRQLPQVEMPLEHRFQDGVYLREITMPTDTYVLGHVHREKHWNMVLSGKALVSVSGGAPVEIKAGDVFESEAGAQKMLYIVETMRFVTVHSNPDNCRDIAALEERIIVASEEFLRAKGTMTIDEFRLSVNKSLIS